MKATLPIAALALLASVMTASAQNPVAKPCIHCDIKDKVIDELKMQIRQLRDQPTGTAEQSQPSAQQQVAQEIANTNTQPKAPVDPPEAQSTPLYTVEPGDNVFKIASKAGCNPETLLSLNDLTMESVIHPGQKLKLPAAAKASTAEVPAQPKTYRIQEGDTYYSLSKRLKIPLDELMAANPQAKATELYAGRTINLPINLPINDSTEAATPAAPRETTAAESAVTDAPATPQPEKKILTIKVEQAISYGEFAAKYGTDIERLNSLNDLNLTGTTTLAKGSELYVPAQP